MSSGLVWFRKDLRFTDNPAWVAATAKHDEVAAIFVVDPRLWEPTHSRRRVQLAAHLHALDRQEGSSLPAIDEITFAVASEGTAISYTADLQFEGLMRFAGPFLGGILK